MHTFVQSVNQMLFFLFLTSYIKKLLLQWNHSRIENPLKLLDKVFGKIVNTWRLRLWLGSDCVSAETIVVLIRRKIKYRRTSLRNSKFNYLLERKFYNVSKNLIKFQNGRWWIIKVFTNVSDITNMSSCERVLKRKGK